MKYLFIISVCLVSAAHGQQIQLAIQKGHSSGIHYVNFNSTGTLLVSSGKDNLIKLWHVRTGKEMATIPNELRAGVDDITFTASDDTLFIQFENGVRQSWDVASLHKIAEEKVSPSGKRPYQSYSNPTADISIDRFYLTKRSKPSGKKQYSKVPTDISKNFTATAVSEQYDRLIGTNEDGIVYVYNFSTGKQLKALSDHLSSVNSVCMSPDQKLFATASDDRTIILWDTKTLTMVKRLYGKSFRLEALAFDDAGESIVAGDELGNIKIVDLVSTTVSVATFKLHDNAVRDVAFTHAGDKLISAGADNRIKIFDLKSQKVVRTDKYRNYVSSGDGMLKLFGSYREPYAWANKIGLSKNDRLVVAGGGWRESIVRRQPQIMFIRDLQTNRVRKLKANAGSIDNISFTGPLTWVTTDKSHVYEWALNPVDNGIYFRSINVPQGEITASASAISNDTIIISSGNHLYSIDLKNNKATSIAAGQKVDQLAVDKTGQRLAYTSGNDIFFTNLKENKSVRIENAHTDKITAIKFSPAKNIVATCSWDATIKLWNADTGKPIITIVSIGKNEHIMVTPENYYFGTRRAIEGIGFKSGKQFISPEQFDLKYNRPDLVLAQLGNVSDRIVKAYRRAYLKRLQKLNFTESMLTDDVELPALAITTDNVPLRTDQQILGFSVKGTDRKYPIDRFNVFVNDVPVFGGGGISVRDKNSQSVDQTLELRLSPGKNKIQVSCQNERGSESLAETFYVDYTGASAKPDLYMIAVAVSNYQDSKMNLKYSKKDGRNVTEMFALRSGIYNRVHVDTLFDRNATRTQVLKLKEKLMKTSVNDQVIVFVAGHGVLDSNLDFYFGTYDIDFSHPVNQGLKYDDLEELLNGIPARRKLLLIDACHAGEVDKSTLQARQTTTLNGNQRGTLTTYSYTVEPAEEQYAVSTKTSFELMQELFGNFSKGSGAVVISASAGNSYALESDEWRNGVFTYSFLSGLKNFYADTNKDRAVTVTEIKNFVSKEVERLTKGEQKPTSRHESLEFDFRIW